MWDRLFVCVNLLFPAFMSDSVAENAQFAVDESRLL